MENKKTLQTYASPEVEISESHLQGVICQSVGTQQYSSNKAENWF